MTSGSGHPSGASDTASELRLELILRQGPLGVERAVRIAKALAARLAAIHASGAICGSLSPSDFTLTDGDSSVDFKGMLMGADRGELALAALPYTAPERTGRTAHAVDQRCDLYSLGVIFYEALAGRPPFRGSSSAALIHAHLALPPPALTTLEPTLPPVLWSIVQHLLEKSPSDRYQSAQSLVDDLERYDTSLRVHGHLPSFEVGVSDTRGRLELPRRIYGREREQQRLAHCLAQARAGQSQLILISGEPGVGKSALIAELRDELVRQGGSFAGGKFNQLPNGPYEAWTEALRQALDEILAAPADVLSRARQAIHDALGEAAGALADLAPSLAAILGGLPALPELPPREAQQRLRAAVTGLVHALHETRRPLVLFLDDLQWSDSASFSLLRDTLLAGRSAGLVLIGSFRAGELLDDNPLPEIVRAVRETSTHVEHIELGALEVSDVASYLSDTLSVSTEEVGALAGIFYAKTLGNPLFVGQLLRTVHARGAIAFSAAGNRWSWSLEALASLDIADNVSAITIERLRALVEPAQRALHALACVGRAAPTDLLAKIADATNDELVALMSAPLEAGSVTVEVSRSANAAGGATVELYRFTHDRVREAAYALRSPAETQATHWRIGRLLHEASQGDPSKSLLFEAVNQLNRGHGSLDPDQRRWLMEPNLRAAGAARATGAFTDALRYYETALSLSPRDLWEVDPEQASFVHLQLADSAYLVSDTARMDREIDAALARLSAPVARAKFLTIRARALNDGNRHDELVELLLPTLRSLGIKLPRRAAMGHVLASFVRTRLQLSRLGKQALLNLPEAANPADLAARELIGTALVSMYRRDLSLYLLLALTLVRQSVSGGNSTLTPFAYATYCVLLISVLDDADEAARFADIAMELAEREAYQLSRPRTGTIVFNLIKHWRSPLRDCLAPLARFHREARLFGDPEYGGLACVTQTFEMAMVGVPLEELERTAKAFSEEYRAYPTILYMNDVWREAVLNLLGQGEGDPVVLTGQTSFDEARTVPELERLGDHTTLCGFHIIKTMLAIVFEQHDVALAQAKLARRHLSGLAAAPHIPYFHFYEALAILGAPATSGFARGRDLVKVRAIVRKLVKWGRGSPTNYEHRACLAQAELAAARGDDVAALTHYERGIELAAKHGFVNDEALGNELAARFHARRGHETLRRIFLSRAAVAYRRWGAQAKVDELRRANPWLDESSDLALDPTSPSVRLSDLDLANLLEASQTLSQVLNLDDFLAKLLATAVLSTGAQRAALVLDAPSELRIRARLSQLGAPVGVVDEPCDGAPGMAHSVVRFVQRARVPLVLGSARSDQRFARDPHVLATGVESILSLPIIGRQEFRGILYLESDVPDAFGSKRLRILEALSGQMAASLENALLHTRLQHALQTQIELTHAHERFVPHQFLSALGHDSIKDVAAGDCMMKEMSVLYSDMRAFTGRLERMSPKQSIDFINGYIRHVEAPILEHSGFIDSFAGDAILALFDAGADATVKASLGMLRALKAFNRECGFVGDQAVRIGIGVNTGNLMLGTIGGHNRIKCGVIGDSVNVAARIEGLTKSYHAPLLIGDSTYRNLTSPDRFCIRLVDEVKVKGRATHVTLYEVFDEDPPELRERKLESLDVYYEAVELYRQRRWSAALALFMRCRVLLPHDDVIRGYVERCENVLRSGDATAELALSSAKV